QPLAHRLEGTLVTGNHGVDQRVGVARAELDVIGAGQRRVAPLPIEPLPTLPPDMTHVTNEHATRVRQRALLPVRVDHATGPPEHGLLADTQPRETQAMDDVL